MRCECRSAERARCSWLTGSGVWYGMGGVLEGKVDVDESCDCLDRSALLSVFDEVSLARLILWVPVKSAMVVSR